MFKPLELFIGLRYTRAKRRNHFISFIALTSMVGIILGVMALITVLSVMNGFEKELRNRILGVVAHATVSEPDGMLRDWSTVQGEVAHQPHVLGAAPYIEGEGMLSASQGVSGALIRGVQPSEEPKVSDIGAKMIAGRLEDLHPDGFGIILGKELALRLGAWVGNKVTLVTPQATVTPAGILPRLKRFTVVGIFEVGMYEYDNGLAVMDLADAAKLFRMGDSVSGLRVKVDDLLRAPAVAHELERKLPPGYVVSDWTQQHVNFFRAVQMEKTVMFVILLLIVAVAAFNIVSTLVMMVRDKEADIAVLRTLGATPRSIMAIFIVQGSVIGVVGTVLGGVFGVLLALNVVTIVPFIEHVFHVEFLSADVYYISERPSDLQWPDVFNICGVSLVLSLVATLYPAWRAARTQPAEALRYE
jgi:lipoprotein-releasing system permease protein